MCKDIGIEPVVLVLRLHDYNFVMIDPYQHLKIVN